jgi:hypothetical protein
LFVDIFAPLGDTVSFTVMATITDQTATIAFTTMMVLLPLMAVPLTQKE